MEQRIRASLKPLAPYAPSLAPSDRASDHDLNPWRPRRETLRPAAVLVPLVRRAEGLTVLLTQRTDHLHDHAGQVSFPGGRIDPEDRGPVDCALRETEEEIGLGREYLELLGLLDDYETSTGYLVTPVVSFVNPGFHLDLDSFEVADTFEVPLSFMLLPQNQQKHSRIFKGKERFYYAFEYHERYIWGATAGMIMNFYRRFTDSQVRGI